MRTIKQLKKKIQLQLRQMDSELSSLPKALKNTLSEQLNKYKQQHQSLSQRASKILHHTSRITNTREDSYQVQSQGLLKISTDVLETGELIDEIERLANQTEGIASDVNENLRVGTSALQSSKDRVINLKKQKINIKQQEINSNLRKSEMAISIMNRKVAVDKITLYAIVVLLAIVDTLALYIMKLR